MFEVIFLFVLGLIWIIFAVVQDLRSKEISDWLNFSLVVFAIAFRFFYSLFGNSGFAFFYQGLIGFGIFWLLGNLMYYGRFFAGGDAKLMIALGAVLPIYYNFLANARMFVLFFAIFLGAGAVYGLSSIIYLGFKNHERFSKGFHRKFSDNRRKIIFVTAVSCIFAILGFVNILFLYLGMIILASTYLYLSSKVIDESCMVKKISTENLREGDWLYGDVKFSKNKLIKSSWDGLTISEINLLKKNKKFVLIKEGIPFSPVFLISYLVLITYLFL